MHDRQQVNSITKELEKSPQKTALERINEARLKREQQAKLFEKERDKLLQNILNHNKELAKLKKQNDHEKRSCLIAEHKFISSQQAEIAGSRIEPEKTKEDEVRRIFCDALISQLRNGKSDSINSTKAYAPITNKEIQMEFINILKTEHP
ncbi:20141_t:CDS:2, partial [Gigaspora margarita]